MMTASIFEALMLVCFGAAWPFSIWRMLKTKRANGKSIIFLVVVLIGYVFGMCFQYFGERSIVMALYIFNAAIVTLDLALTIKYCRSV